MGPLVTARGLWSCGAWAQKLRQRIQSTRGLSGCGVWLQLLWGTQPGDWTHTMKWSPHSVQCKSIISYRYRVVAHQPCPTPCHRWTAACQASLSSTSSWGFLKRMPIVWLMPSNQLILWRPFSSCPQSLETEKKKVFLLMKTLNIYSLHSFHL